MIFKPPKPAAFARLKFAYSANAPKAALSVPAARDLFEKERIRNCDGIFRQFLWSKPKFGATKRRQKHLQGVCKRLQAVILKREKPQLRGDFRLFA